MVSRIVAQAIPVRQQSLREGSIGDTGESGPPASRPTNSCTAPAAHTLVTPVPAKLPAKGITGAPDTSKGISQNDPKVVPLANGGFTAANAVQAPKPVSKGPAVPENPSHAHAPVGVLPRPSWLQDLMYESRWISNADPQACLFVDETKKAVLRGALSTKCVPPPLHIPFFLGCNLAGLYP